MLERGVKPPVVCYEMSPGSMGLFMPCQIKIEPLTLTVIDFSVGVRLSTGWGGKVKLRPHMLGRHTQSRVMGIRVGEFCRVQTRADKC